MSVRDRRIWITRRSCIHVRLVEPSSLESIIDIGVFAFSNKFCCCIQLSISSRHRRHTIGRQHKAQILVKLFLNVCITCCRRCRSWRNRIRIYRRRRWICGRRNNRSCRLLASSTLRYNANFHSGRRIRHCNTIRIISYPATAYLQNRRIGRLEVIYKSFCVSIRVKGERINLPLCLPTHRNLRVSPIKKILFCCVIEVWCNIRERGCACVVQCLRYRVFDF